MTQANEPNLKKIFDETRSWVRWIVGIGIIMLMIAGLDLLVYLGAGKPALAVIIGVTIQGVLLFLTAFLLNQRHPLAIATLVLETVLALAMPLLRGEAYDLWDLLLLVFPLIVGQVFYKAWKQGYFSPQSVPYPEAEVYKFD